VNGPPGGLGRYAVTTLKVCCDFPRTRLQHHLPSLAGSCPLSIIRWAALSKLKRAVPPNCHTVLGTEVVLWLRLICYESHQPLVLWNKRCSSGRSLQSKFVSANPKISNDHVVIPTLNIYQMTTWSFLPSIFPLSLCFSPLDILLYFENLSLILVNPFVWCSHRSNQTDFPNPLAW